MGSWLEPPEHKFTKLDDFLTSKYKVAVIRQEPLLHDRSLLVVEFDLEQIDLPDCYYDESDYECVYQRDVWKLELFIAVYRKRVVT